MNINSILNFLLTKPALLLIIILTLTAIYIIYRLRSASFGALKYGRVMMADHSNWRPCTRSFFSKNFLLTGRIDYVIDVGGGMIIPVEVKSTPWRGRIYDSHRMEVGTACLLIEEQYHVPPKYGVIQYGGGETFEIPYTQDLKQQVLQIMQQMRSLQLPHGWRPDPRRCRSCSMRLKCNRAVVA